MKKTTLLPILLCSLFCIRSSAQTCYDAAGVYQSPVPIKNALKSSDKISVKVTFPTPDTLGAFYSSSANNIEVEVENANKQAFNVTYNDSVYTFNNVHFHYPSEHVLFGVKQSGMEAHFVSGPTAGTLW